MKNIKQKSSLKNEKQQENQLKGFDSKVNSSQQSKEVIMNAKKNKGEKS